MTGDPLWCACGHPDATVVQKKRTTPGVLANYQYAVNVGEIILVCMHPK